MGARTGPEAPASRGKKGYHAGRMPVKRNGRGGPPEPFALAGRAVSLTAPARPPAHRPREMRPSFARTAVFG